jgi:hypothetical protein
MQLPRENAIAAIMMSICCIGRTIRRMFAFTRPSLRGRLIGVRPHDQSRQAQSLSLRAPLVVGRETTFE